MMQSQMESNTTYSPPTSPYSRRHPKTKCDVNEKIDSNAKQLEEKSDHDQQQHKEEDQEHIEVQPSVVFNFESAKNSPYTRRYPASSKKSR